MNNKQYKAERLTAVDGMQLTANMYNLVIGLVLLWGVLINVGMAMFLAPVILQANTAVILILYLAGSIGCMMVVYRSKSPLISFLGFSGLAASMGLILTYFLTTFSGQAVINAFLMTAIVTFATMLIATIFPATFLKAGRSLCTILLITIIVELLTALIFHVNPVSFDYIVVLIFCGFIGFDWAKAQVYPKTLDNAIDCAADIYVDIVNIFIRILDIMGKKNN